MPAFVDFQNMVVKTLRAHLNFSHAEMTQPFKFVGINFIGTSLDDQSHVAMSRSFVDGLRLCEHLSLSLWERGWGEGVHRIETTLDKPFLIIAFIRRPCAAENQQLNFIGGMTQIFERANPRMDLLVGIKLMFQRAHRAGFVGQIALGHTHIGGTKNTLARTWVRLCQHSHRRHARKRTHRFHADTFQQRLICRDSSRLHHLMIRGDERGFGQIARAVFQRIASQRAHHVAARANLIQNMVREREFLRRKNVERAPALLSFRNFHCQIVQRFL